MTTRLKRNLTFSFINGFCGVVIIATVIGGIMAAEQQQQKKMTGAMGDVKTVIVNSDNKEDADMADKLTYFLDQVKAQAEDAAGRKFDTLIPVQYATQLVNGLNYFIKAKTGDAEYVFIRLWKPFQGDKVTFTSIKDGKKAEDDLTYF